MLPLPYLTDAPLSANVWNEPSTTNTCAITYLILMLLFSFIFVSQYFTSTIRFNGPLPMSGLFVIASRSSRSLPSLGHMLLSMSTLSIQSEKCNSNIVYRPHVALDGTFFQETTSTPSTTGSTP